VHPIGPRGPKNDWSDPRGRSDVIVDGSRPVRGWAIWSDPEPTASSTKEIQHVPDRSTAERKPLATSNRKRLVMSTLSGYQDKYPGIRFERRDGVLQVSLHHEGGEFIVTESALRDLGRAFIDVAEDYENKVVILTGTGDRFATQFDYGSFIAKMQPDVFDFWIHTRTDGVRLVQAFLDIEVPVISAINGPVVTHSETPLLADVVLATEDTVFQDATHFLNGLPPGDGMHTVWTTPPRT
jgi:hypothetical protein